MSRVLTLALVQITLLILLTIAPHAIVNLVQAENSKDIRVFGRIVDYSSAQGIPNAKIMIEQWNSSEGYYDKTTIYTSISGDYEVTLEASSYLMTVSSDDPETPGVDYVPLRKDYNLQSISEESLNVSFTLLPGASVHFIGLLPQEVYFIVSDEYGLLSWTGSISYWGAYFYDLFNLTDGTAVVPADIPVRIAMGWYVFYEGGYGGYLYTVPLEGYLNLTQGSELSIDATEIIVSSDLKSVQIFLAAVKSRLNDLEGIGCYVKYERMRVEGAEDLAELARVSFSEGYYDDAQADLKEANIILRDVETTLSTFSQESSYSALFLTPLLALTAFILASFFTEGLRKVPVSIASCGLLLTIAYLSHPGYASVQQTIINVYQQPVSNEFLGMLIILSISVLLVIAFLLKGQRDRRVPPTQAGEAARESPDPLGVISEVFKFASGNLKRRRLRTFLAASFILVSIFCFVTLTTYSLEFGLIVQQEDAAVAFEEILIRQREIPIASGPFRVYNPSFGPIDVSLVKWLRSRNETILVAPLVENLPNLMWPPDLLRAYSPLVIELLETELQYLITSGMISTNSSPTRVVVCRPGLEYNVSGILGIYPSLEAEVSDLPDIVTHGRFLSDEDLNGILISQEAAQKLQVSEGDGLKMFDRNYTVVGIFDSSRLKQTRDPRGDALIPQQIVVSIMYVVLDSRLGPVPILSLEAENVASENVIVLHAKAVEELPLETAVMRVRARTERSEDAVALARRAALIFPRVDAYVSSVDKIQRFSLGTYHVVRGFAEWSVLMGLVVLNVGVVMMSAVYERRREIFIMSSVGLNPSHITAIFLAESLMVGIVAGTLGYLLSMTSYRLFVLLASPLVVKYKIEAGWGILTFCLAIAATSLGAIIPARKASTVTTPSLLKEFQLTVEDKPRKKGEYWTLSIPIRFREEEVPGFFSFMEKRLRIFESTVVEQITNLERSRERDRPLGNRLSFRYIYANRLYTMNHLVPAVCPEPNWYTVRLMSMVQSGPATVAAFRDLKSEEMSIRQVAAFIRQLTLAYTIARQED